MSNYRPDTYCVRLFVGEGKTPQEACDAAAGRLNEWEPFRKWHTPDGKSCYDVSTQMVAVYGSWMCVLTAVGIDFEAREQPRAYTGQTERLG